MTMDGTVTVWSIVFIVGVSSQSCPEQCKCIYSQLVCDGAIVDQTTFPPLENHTWIGSLLVVNTNLPNLQNGEIILPAVSSLRHVILFSNGIKTLNASMFRNNSKITSLVLSNNKLDAVPYAAIKPLTKLAYLALSRNKIHTIENNAFLHNHNLEKLFLDFNRISDIHLDSFNGLGRLIYLHLSNNSITRYPLEGSIQDFSALKGLYMTGNVIGNVFARNYTFSTCVTLDMGYNSLSHLANFSLVAFPRITTLFISNNIINRVDDFLFGRSHHPLEYLSFSNNNLSELPIGLFRNLPKLRSLNMARNKITAVPGRAFLNNKVLQTLVLYSNSIQTIHPSALDGLTNLLSIEVQYNKLTTFPSGYLDLPYNIQLLWLDGNYWDCDCDLFAIQKWYEKTNRHLWATVCTSPPEMRGTLIIDVPFKEFCNDMEGTTSVDISEHATNYGLTSTKATLLEFVRFHLDVFIVAMVLVFITGGNLICLTCLCSHCRKGGNFED